MRAIKFEDVTKEQLGKWKNEYGQKSIRQVDVKYKGKTISYIIKLPDLSVMESVANLMDNNTTSNTPATAKNIIQETFGAAIIAGDTSLLDNWEIGRVVFEEIQKMLVDFAGDMSEYIN